MHSCAPCLGVQETSSHCMQQASSSCDNALVDLMFQCVCGASDVIRQDSDHKLCLLLLCNSYPNSRVLHPALAANMHRMCVYSCLFSVLSPIMFVTCMIRFGMPSPVQLHYTIQLDVQMAIRQHHPLSAATSATASCQLLLC